MDTTERVGEKQGMLEPVYSRSPFSRTITTVLLIVVVILVLVLLMRSMKGEGMVDPTGVSRGKLRNDGVLSHNEPFLSPTSGEPPVSWQSAGAYNRSEAAAELKGNSAAAPQAESMGNRFDDKALAASIGISTV